MTVQPSGPDDRRGGDAGGRWAGPPRLPPTGPLHALAGPLRWLANRPDLLMAAVGVLIVGVAVFMPDTPPAQRPAQEAIERTASAPIAGAIPSALASDAAAEEAALLAAASEAAGLATNAAAPLLPPPPSAVLAPEGDSVFAAAEPARPEPEPSAPTKRKSGAVLIFDADAGDASDDAAPAPEVSIAPASRRPLAAAAGTTPSGKAATSRGTLTQGTAIPAVLESAIDSSRPGSVRALVSTDVRSADGRRVLVPRSSRLVGQYRGDPGTARAFVVWTRIERPDGSRVPLATAGQGARFKESYATSPLVSQVGGAEPRGSVRVRPGEPIRVIASRSVDLQETRR